MQQIADVRGEPDPPCQATPGCCGVPFGNSLAALVTIQLVRHIDGQMLDSKWTS
jgi:hypothetical protein